MSKELDGLKQLGRLASKNELTKPKDGGWQGNMFGQIDDLLSSKSRKSTTHR